jgi:hypothetical protein
MLGQDAERHRIAAMPPMHRLPKCGPPMKGRQSYQYKCRIKAVNAHYDLWLTEKNLRLIHPDSAPSLIAACDAKR